jgi:hypothetical protein
MSMSNNQEINLNLKKYLLANKKRKEVEDILVLIVGACIIQLDI